MVFFYVYVLRSLTHNSIYIGYTENLKRRLAEHNLGQVVSTKHYHPLELIHYEAYKNQKDAKRREGYLKTSRGKTTLRTMLIDFFKS
jgi:putative endonuclease